MLVIRPSCISLSHYSKYSGSSLWCGARNSCAVLVGACRVWWGWKSVFQARVSFMPCASKLYGLLFGLPSAWRGTVPHRGRKTPVPGLCCSKGTELLTRTTI